MVLTSTGDTREPMPAHGELKTFDRKSLRNFLTENPQLKFQHQGFSLKKCIRDFHINKKKITPIRRFDHPQVEDRCGNLIALQNVSYATNPELTRRIGTPWVYLSFADETALYYHLSLEANYCVV
jgi:hypothetical protein